MVGESAEPRVVLGEWQHDAGFRRAIATPATLIPAPTLRDEDVVPLLRGADAFLSKRFTPGMAAAADRLRLILTPGAGTNQIDFAAVPAALGLADLGAMADLPRLLAEADFVVLAVPLDPSTTGLIGAAELAAMKPTAFLVNVARGEVVAEAALYEALRDGRIAGAAIDTWYRYPEAGEPLRPSAFPFHELPNAILTPHIAGWTEGTFRQRWVTIAENLRRLGTGEPFLNVVWPTG